MWSFPVVYVTLCAFVSLNRAYFLAPFEDSYFNAERYCNDLGSNLASSHSVSDDEQLHELCATTGGECWIGFYWEALFGAWSWEDGSDHLSYTNWANEETNQKNSAYIDSTDGFWHPTDESQDGARHFICNGDATSVSVRVTACDGWGWGSSSNAMQIRLRGRLLSTELLDVNAVSSLPTDGATMSYNVSYANEIGDFQGIMLSVDDDLGYCLKSMDVLLMQNVTDNSTESGFSAEMMTFSFDEDFFGHGLVLSTSCDFSFRFISNEQPLLRCLDSTLNLNIDEPRGIYPLSLHTCNHDDAGMLMQNVSENVYAVVTGKMSGYTAYASSEPVFLDHSHDGGVDWTNVGHLAHGGVSVDSKSGNVTVYSPIAGSILGVKLEVVNYHKNKFKECKPTKEHPNACSMSVYLPQQDYKIEENAEGKPIGGEIHDKGGFYDAMFFDAQGYYDDSQGVSASAGSGRFLIAFVIPYPFHQLGMGGGAYYQQVTPTSAITVTGLKDLFEGPFDDNFAEINVHLILAGSQPFDYDAPDGLYGNVGDYEDGPMGGNLYQFPFTRLTGDGFTRNDAMQGCMDQFGTSLASIHNDDEQFLAVGLTFSRPYTWIGLQNFGGSAGWVWDDGSTTERYSKWTDDKPADDEHCAVLGSHLDGISIQNLQPEDLKWFSRPCTQSEVHNYALCSSPWWGSNQDRLFELNVEKQLDAVVVTVGNRGEDELCLDGSVQIGDESALYVSGNWIGGDCVDCRDSIAAVFREPVCATEAIKVEVPQNSTLTKVEPLPPSAIKLKCSNQNRLLPSECTVSQSYEKSKTSSFFMSDEATVSSGYSWGSSSSISLGFSKGKEHSVSTTNEFQWGMEETVNAGFKMFGVDVGAELSSNQQWTESETVTDTSSNEVNAEGAHEENEENSVESSSSSGTESGWEYTETTMIECAGSMEVPPGHSVGYTLNFTGYEFTTSVLTDLKLTLCSALVRDDGGAVGDGETDVDAAERRRLENDGEDYVYIRGIPGLISHRETQSCSVEFGPAEYIENEVACVDEVRLAIASGSTYVPRCRSENATRYDGCQCDIGDSLTMGTCWCSDAKGNAKGAIYQFGDMAFEKVCADILKCEDSEVEFEATTEAPMKAMLAQHGQGNANVAEVSSENGDGVSNEVLSVWMAENAKNDEMMSAMMAQSQEQSAHFYTVVGAIVVAAVLCWALNVGCVKGPTKYQGVVQTDSEQFV